MKGVGIICVVIGHSSFTADSIVRFIYSWHMPLFFILSGYFYKKCGISDRFKKDIRTLMCPYIFAVTSIAIVALIEKYLINVDHLNHIIWGGLFGTPRALYNPDTFFGRGYIGALWFVPAIFMCRVIYNILPKDLLVRNLLIGGGIHLLSIYCSTKFGHFPMCLLQALAALVYYHIGVMLGKYKAFEYSKNPVVLTVCVVAVILSFLYGGKLVFAACSFPSPFINLCGAVATTVILYVVVENSWLKKSKFLEYIGRISLLILSVHAFDILLDVSTVIGLIGKNRLNIDWQVIEFISRLIVAIFGALILCNIPLIRKIYSIPPVLNFKNKIVEEAGIQK